MGQWPADKHAQLVQHSLVKRTLRLVCRVISRSPRGRPLRVNHGKVEGEVEAILAQMIHTTLPYLRRRSSAFGWSLACFVSVRGSNCPHAQVDAQRLLYMSTTSPQLHPSLNRSQQQSQHRNSNSNHNRLQILLIQCQHSPHPLSPSKSLIRSSLTGMDEWRCSAASSTARC